MVGWTALGAASLAAVLVACSDGTEPTNPTPGITELAPAEVEQGREGLTLTITGTDFVRRSVVRFNGGDRETQYVSATELRANLPASDFASTGTAQVVVVNPSPGGGTSNPVSLPIKPATNPVPAISTLTPNFVEAGASGVDVTITGTGFVPQSRVVFSSTNKTVTYVSSTQVRISFTQAELAASATLQLRVINPSPGGGVSNPAAFEIRSPVPAISSLSATQTTAGEASFALRVTGTGFLATSQVRFNGAPVATRVVVASVLEATLTETNLAEPGTFNVTVSNPAPGGGTSNALPFTLVVGAPEITLLPSRGAAAGRPGFTLYIHGRRFVPASVVRWNGADRPTTYVSGTRITATITTSDVAQPGTVQITVVNPGGTASTAATMTVRTLGASTSTNLLVPLIARDIAFEATTQRLYASIPGSSSTDANSIVQIDPLSGTITASVFVGSEPGNIALSDDGRYLYVGLNGANAVRRVELPAMSATLQWGLSPSQVAGDLHVAPGMPGTVAVSRQVPGSSPPLNGVTIYDDGVPRPTSSPGHTGGNRIEFLDSPSVLYGFNNAHTGFEFFTIGIDATGARHLSATSGLIGGFYTNIVGAAGRIYGTDGAIVDAERRVRIGTFPQDGTIAIDAALGRAYILKYILGNSQIGVYDLNNFGLLGTITFPTATFDHPAAATPRLVRWGTDGLAFLDQTRLFLIRSPLIGP